MVKQAPVNITWQIVLVFLPITTLFLGSLWAAYRVQKLRKLLLLVLIMTVVFFIIYPIDWESEDESEDEDCDLYCEISFWFNPFDGYFEDIDLFIKLAWILEFVIWFSVIAFFIHKWSKEWNQNFFHTGNFKSVLT